MQIKDLIPWGRERQAATPAAEPGNASVASLQRDINRLFDDFWTRFDRPLGGPGGSLATGYPRADVSETDHEVEIAVELPGLEQKDVDVSLTEDVLTIRGEKKTEREEKKKGYHLSERSVGSFHRMIPIPPGVDTAKAEATFKNGVLTVRLPKTAEAQAKIRRIEVKAS